MAGRDVLARTWYEQARADLDAAVDSTAAGHHEWACFQAQQAGEKALRAFLYARGRTSIVTHSLRRLAREAAGFDPGTANSTRPRGCSTSTTSRRAIPTDSTTRRRRPPATRGGTPSNVCGLLARSSRASARPSRTMPVLKRSSVRSMVSRVTLGASGRKWHFFAGRQAERDNPQRPAG